MLTKGNAKYAKDKTLISTAGIKIDILERLAGDMFKYAAYPDADQIEIVARELVKKHQCLKEPGSSNGYNGRKQSLTFKMGNFQSKLRDSGCEELLVNSLKRKGDHDKHTAKNIKKPSKAEVNFLPGYQPDESEATSEILRVSLLDKCLW